MERASGNTMIPQDAAQKAFCLQGIVTALTDFEISNKTKTFDMGPVVQTIESWSLSGFDQGFPIGENITYKLNESDIIEALDYSMPGNTPDEKLQLFITDTILKKMTEDQYYLYKDKGETQTDACLRVDNYLMTRDPQCLTGSSITSSPRQYAVFLGPDRINNLLCSVNKPNVVSYLGESKNKQR